MREAKARTKVGQDLSGFLSDFLSDHVRLGSDISLRARPTVADVPEQEAVVTSKRTEADRPALVLKLLAPTRLRSGGCNSHRRFA